MAMNRIDFDSHRRAQQAEDVAFLVAGGMTFEAACERVGVQPDTVERRGHARAPKKEAAR